MFRVLDIQVKIVLQAANFRIWILNCRSKTMPNQSYWNRLNLVHDLAEEATGVPFDDFIELCEGNKAVAALYFGWALWRVLGRAKYDNAYKRKIGLLQKKRPLKFESLTKLSELIYR